MNYITVQEASDKWNIGARRICILCKEGRISGAVKKSRVWMIPETAKKPDDGRKAVVRQGVPPLLLAYNPTYFETKSIEPIPEEKRICEIQELFLNGRFDEAYNETCKALLTCVDNRYKCFYYFLKMIICADFDKKGEYFDSALRLQELASEDDACRAESVLMRYFLGQIDYLDNTMFGEEYLDELVPFIGMLIAKKSINELLKSGSRVDASGIEFLCHELDKRESLLLTAYCHIFMAVYYNILCSENNFEYHYSKALDILLPRKWYTPLAEYSATIDADYLKSIDMEAYQAVLKLSDSIIASYVNLGIFDDIVEQPRLKTKLNVQIGYKLVQGKNIETIAREIGISQYKVKQHIDDLYSIVGINSKKEIRQFVLNNLMI